MLKCIAIIRILFYVHQTLSYIHHTSQISVHLLNNILLTSSSSQYPASVHNFVSMPPNLCENNISTNRKPRSQWLIDILVFEIWIVLPCSWCHYEPITKHMLNLRKNVFNSNVKKMIQRVSAWIKRQGACWCHSSLSQWVDVNCTSALST